MNYLYFAIVGLSVYGDTLKWILPADAALATLYVLAAAVLVAIVAIGRPLKLQRDARVVAILALVLVGCYATQAATSFEVPLEGAMKTALYVSIPLLYIVAIQKYWVDFDIERTARIFLICMVPINVVGAIQYFVDPSFLVLTTYSDETAIIVRNLGEGESFSRYPSIFASADRYSAMALMQFYFSLVVLQARDKRSYWGWAWVLANLALSVVALFIAGARSRVMIAGGLSAILMFGLVFAAVTSNRLSGRTKVAGFAVFTALACVAVIVWPDEAQRAEFPVLELLHRSIEGGEISDRINDAIYLSMIDNDISMFGNGLGSESEGGRPGEFGIMTIWAESGLFWGVVMVGCFAGMVWMLLKSAVIAFMRRQPVNAAIFAFPSVLLLFAVVAGLSSSFELSTGLMLATSIAWVTQHREKGIGEVDEPGWRTTVMPPGARLGLIRSRRF